MKFFMLLIAFLYIFQVFALRASNRSTVALSTVVECDPPHTRTWLRVSDSGNREDTLWFGFDSAATCDVDTHLCENLYIPCDPAGVFCAQWSLTCNDGGGWYTLGSYDYRQYLNSTEVDTHVLDFQPSSAGYPFRFYWSRNDVAALCDSAVLMDVFGGIVYRQRMDTTDSLIVLNTTIHRLWLIRYGQKSGITSAEPSKDQLFSDARLMQNYPNPFKPSTVIKYAIPQDVYVTLKVYDLLGREVVTLVDGFEHANWYDVKFNAQSLPSGIYFCKLTAGDASAGSAQRLTQVRRMLLAK